MHRPSVPDALTAEPSHPPSLVAVPFGSTKDGGRLVLFCLKYPSLHFSGCCAVWKHQRREGRGKRFHLPVCSRLRQNKETKGSQQLSRYTRSSSLCVRSSRAPKSTSEHQAKQIGRTLLQTHTCLIFTAVRSVRSWTVRAPNPTRKLSIQIDRSG